ncbi:hypothetical protein ILUMI_12175, partial [Ignelater luminosus]
MLRGEKYKKKYFAEDLKNTLDAFRSGMPLRKAARRFGVPRATSQFRLSGNFTKAEHRPPVLYKLPTKADWLVIPEPCKQYPPTLYPLGDAPLNNMKDGASSTLPKIIEETTLSSNAYDGILVVVPPTKPLKAASKLESVITSALRYDPSLETEIAVLPLPDLPAGRLVYAPTGPLDPDYDDVRSLQETAAKGLKRALKAGIRKLLVVLEEYSNFENSELVTLLGILEALYTPIQAREVNPSKAAKLDHLGVYTNNENKTKQVTRLAKAIEYGRFIARDIGGADPERMTPINVQNYVEEIFSKTNIKISVIDDPNVFAKEYPLFEAVNRAASVVDRHRGRIIYLEYDPPAEVKETLLLVGKGVTYDTGGADIKAGGVMSSMCRDKCGAAAVAGFLQIVNELQPKHTKVIGAMSLVRNSVGSNCYVADEIIMSRSKATVRVGNTDAEGRMVMADVLCR